MKTFHARGCLLLLTLCVMTAQAHGGSLEGTYQFVSVGSDDIAAAIERCVEGMNLIKRPIARSRLKKTNAAYRSISIARIGSDVSISFDGKTPIKTPASGTIVKWQRDDGERFDVAAIWELNSLTQRFKAEDGERLNTFRLSEDGASLTLQVKLTSDQLPTPVSYSLAYQRTQ